MAVVKWRFEDPVLLETYIFEVNPNDGGSPQYAKNLIYTNTSAPDGAVIAFEGREKPKVLEWSGILLTEDQFNAYVEWYLKKYQIIVTDDLGREFSVIIESFAPKRQRAVHYPWKHSYSVKATIVDWQ